MVDGISWLKGHHDVQGTPHEARGVCPGGLNSTTGQGPERQGNMAKQVSVKWKSYVPLEDMKANIYNMAPVDKRPLD